MYAAAVSLAASSSCNPFRASSFASSMTGGGGSAAGGGGGGGGRLRLHNYRLPPPLRRRRVCRKRGVFFDCASAWRSCRPEHRASSSALPGRTVETDRSSGLRIALDSLREDLLWFGDGIDDGIIRETLVGGDQSPAGQWSIRGVTMASWTSAR